MTIANQRYFMQPNEKKGFHTVPNLRAHYMYLNPGPYLGRVKPVMHDIIIQ